MEKLSRFQIKLEKKERLELIKWFNKYVEARTDYLKFSTEFLRMKKYAIERSREEMLNIQDLLRMAENY